MVECLSRVPKLGVQFSAAGNGGTGLKSQHSGLEARGSEAQGHAQMCSEFEASMGCVRVCLRKAKRKKKKRKNKRRRRILPSPVLARSSPSDRSQRSPPPSQSTPITVAVFNSPANTKQ